MLVTESGPQLVVAAVVFWAREQWAVGGIVVVIVAAGAKMACAANIVVGVPGRVVTCVPVVWRMGVRESRDRFRGGMINILSLVWHR